MNTDDDSTGDFTGEDGAKKPDRALLVWLAYVFVSLAVAIGFSIASPCPAIPAIAAAVAGHIAR